MVNLTLSVSEPTMYITTDTSACGMLSLNGVDYFSNITIVDTLPTHIGCDSVIITYNITIYPASAVPIEEELIGCGELLYNGVLYTQSDTLIDTIHSIHGCDSIYHTVYIKIVDFELSLAVDTVDIYEGEYIELISSANMEYSVIAWTPTAAFESQTVKSQFTIIPASGNYAVIAKNEDGCIDTASVYINLIPYYDDILIPNAFSPNGDGLNDVFGPKFRIERDYNIDRFLIYNRWGQLVYSNYNKRALFWDGFYNGQPADAGVYYYELLVDFRGKKKYLKGEVHLVK